METYTTSDFSELADALTAEHLAFFVGAVNHIASERESVCDFYVVMKKINERCPSAFMYLAHFLLKTKALGVYLYCKLLLMDADVRDRTLLSFLATQKCIADTMYTCNQRRDTLAELMRYIYCVANDEKIQDFTDYRDMYREYRPLDVAKISYIDSAPDEYFTPTFIDRVMNVAQMYAHAKCVHQLMYFFSETHDMTIPHSSGHRETFTDDADGFVRRFEARTDTYVLLWKHLYNQRSAPSADEDVYEKCAAIVRNVWIGQVMNADKYKSFLRDTFGYDRSTDNCNVFLYMTYNAAHSGRLCLRFRSYFNTTLYRSLQTVFNVRKHKVSEHPELAAYLDVLLAAHSFSNIKY